MSERDYLRGRQAAQLEILRALLRDPALAKMAGVADPGLAIERQETVAAMRKVCGEHGDDDWPDDLHLADVIDKHLAPYLGSGRRRCREQRP